MLYAKGFCVSVSLRESEECNCLPLLPCNVLMMDWLKRLMAAITSCWKVFCCFAAPHEVGKVGIEQELAEAVAAFPSPDHTLAAGGHVDGEGADYVVCEIGDTLRATTTEESLLRCVFKCSKFLLNMSSHSGWFKRLLLHCAFLEPCNSTSSPPQVPESCSMCDLSIGISGASLVCAVPPSDVSERPAPLTPSHAMPNFRKGRSGASVCGLSRKISDQEPLFECCWTHSWGRKDCVDG
jgi:hypothetical protein